MSLSTLPANQGIASRKGRAGENTPSNTNCKGSVRPITAFHDGHLTTKIASRPVQDLVRVAMLLGIEASIV